MNTDTSSNSAVNSGISGRKGSKSDKSIGLCLNCGRRITLCGRPFTADVKCNKCKYINHFEMSQQPVTCHP